MVAKAYLDQLERSQALPADQIAAVRKDIQTAESSRMKAKETAKLKSFAPSLKESAAKALTTEEGSGLTLLTFGTFALVIFLLNTVATSQA